MARHTTFRKKKQKTSMLKSISIGIRHVPPVTSYAKKVN